MSVGHRLHNLLADLQADTLVGSSHEHTTKSHRGRSERCEQSELRPKQHYDVYACGADASERPTEASGAQNGEIAKRTTTARRVDGRARYDCKQLPIAHYAGSPL